MNHDEEVDLRCDPFRRIVSRSGSKEDAPSAEVYFALSIPASGDLVPIVQCRMGPIPRNFLSTILQRMNPPKSETPALRELVEPATNRYTAGVRVMALCGSLRFRSSNRALLLAARKLAPEGMDISIFESILDLPHFNPDLDGPERDPEDRPGTVLRLRRDLAASNAMLISTPEYAHGLPGSLKNALDWLVSSPAIIGKPVALIYGSAGGAHHAQEHLKEILTTMSAVIVRDAIVALTGVRSKIDDHGTVYDPQMATQIERALEALAAFASRQQ